ncbi:MAG: hypothetical protein KDB03_18460 [Planctomycetales bacterium]|nr:hypothetical protein [Planctomycetales bacterium]
MTTQRTNGVEDRSGNSIFYNAPTHATLHRYYNSESVREGILVQPNSYPVVPREGVKMEGMDLAVLDGTSLYLPEWKLLGIPTS